MKKYNYLFAGLAVLLTLLFVTSIDSFARVKQDIDNSDAIAVKKVFKTEVASATGSGIETKSTRYYDDAIPYEKKLKARPGSIKPLEQNFVYRLVDVAFQRITDLLRNYIDDPSVNPRKVINVE